jgi:hypothetical protein
MSLHNEPANHPKGIYLFAENYRKDQRLNKNALKSQLEKLPITN